MPEPTATTDPTTTTPPPAAPPAQGAKNGTPPGATGSEGTNPPAAPVVELKFPEHADAGLVDGFKAWAKEAKVEGKSAQTLVDLVIARSKAHEEAQTAAYAKQDAEWKQQLADDKEIGGAHLEANRALAAKAIERLGSPGLRQLLEKSGLGNHPDLVRFAVKVGKALSEDSIAGTGVPTPKAPSPEEALRSRYNHPTSH